MPVLGESLVRIDVGAGRLGMAGLRQPLKKGHGGTAQTVILHWGNGEL